MTAWPWPSSESTVKVIAAFVAALQAVQDVARNKSASIETKSGSRMNYGYADLDAVLDASKPVLTASGLAVTQAATVEGVHAVVMHETGEWLAFPPLQVVTAQNTPQGQGSALTYARRYQMLALLGIATEDDDGTAASKRATTPKRDATTPKPAPAVQPNPNRTASGLNGDKPTPAMIRMAGALFNGRGWEEAERHDRTSELVGHRVDSWDDMSRAEFSAMLDKLKAAET